MLITYHKDYVQTPNRKVLTIDENGNANIVQHAHPDSSTISFSKEGIVADQDFILIDLSDLVNYKHKNLGLIHIESIFIITESSTIAQYDLEFGFLDNVDSVNGDFHSILNIPASRQTGNQMRILYESHPNMVKCSPDFYLTSRVFADDVSFQDDLNLASTLDPTTLNTPSGDGDLILMVRVDAGTVDISVNISYHTHKP